MSVVRVNTGRNVVSVTSVEMWFESPDGCYPWLPHSSKCVRSMKKVQTFFNLESPEFGCLFWKTEIFTLTIFLITFPHVPTGHKMHKNMCNFSFSFQHNLLFIVQLGHAKVLKNSWNFLLQKCGNLVCGICN